MKITKSVSEKITFKNDMDQFHSREFTAGRSVDVPDDSSLSFIQLRERELDLDLRKQVLTNFLLENVITQTTMAEMLEPYKQLLAAARSAHDKNASPGAPSFL